MKIERRPSTALSPVPAVLVTVADGAGASEGKGNLITIAWAGTVCSSPPMLSVAIRQSRYSHALVQEAREFVVNLPRAAPGRTGRPLRHAQRRRVDKWAAAGLTAVARHPRGGAAGRRMPRSTSNACVRHQLTLGIHDLFIAEIVAVHYDEERPRFARSGQGRRPSTALTFVDGEYWSLKEKVGTYGFAKKLYEQEDAAERVSRRQAGSALQPPAGGLGASAAAAPATQRGDHLGDVLGRRAAAAADDVGALGDQLPAPARRSASASRRRRSARARAAAGRRWAERAAGASVAARSSPTSAIISSAADAAVAAHHVGARRPGASRPPGAGRRPSWCDSRADRA